MDCLEGMELLEDDIVDVIVTSPPCDIGVHQSRRHDDMPRRTQLLWIGG
jgi:DNA modification methylase